jgi:hypothetical protein
MALQNYPFRKFEFVTSAVPERQWRPGQTEIKYFPAMINIVNVTGFAILFASDMHLTIKFSANWYSALSVIQAILIISGLQS